MTGKAFSQRDIHLALDGELPPDERDAYERWLEGNLDMKAKSLRYSTDGSMLRTALGPVLDEPVPARLAGLSVSRPSGPPRVLWRMLIAAAILAVGGLAGFMLGHTEAGGADNAGSHLADRAIAAHIIYAGDKEHLVDIGANRKPQLIGWLSNRIGTHLIAPDLRGLGFEFVGGRLLPSGHDTAAQLMYRNPKGVVISLYITRNPVNLDTGFRLLEEDGARAYYWLNDGLEYAVAGSLSEKAMFSVAKLVYQQFLNGKA